MADAVVTVEKIKDRREEVARRQQWTLESRAMTKVGV